MGDKMDRYCLRVRASGQWTTLWVTEKTGPVNSCLMSGTLGTERATKFVERWRGLGLKIEDSPPLPDAVMPQEIDAAHREEILFKKENA